MCDNFQQQKKQEAINMAENKTKPVQIRMTEAQYEAIRNKAEKLGMNMSQFMIFSAMNDNDNTTEAFQSLQSEITSLTSVVERLSVFVRNANGTVEGEDSIADLLRKGGFENAANWLELMS